MQKMQKDHNWGEHYRQALDLHKAGRLPEAIEIYDQALQFLHAQFALIHHNLGVAHFQQGQFKKALACFQATLLHDPTMPDAYYSGGNTLCAIGRLNEAIDWYLQAIALTPNDADIHYNLANTYKSLENYPKAAKHYQAALQLKPDFAETHNNLGIVLMRQGQLDKAAVCFQKALKLKPGYTEACYNMAVVLKRREKVSEAIHFARQALEYSPGYSEAIVLLVPLLQQMCDWKALEAVESQIESITVAQLKKCRRPTEGPFLSFTRSVDPQRNLDVASAWAAWVKQRIRYEKEKLNFQWKPRNRRRITIGYLSEQFRNAATAHLMVSLFSRHDRRCFEIIAYSMGPDDRSYYRRKIERDVDRFVDISIHSNVEAAQRIYADQVDILVDLTGWMHGHRITIPALQPAPIQVNYLGYPGTTGADFMDYILADRIVIPENHQHYFTEQVVYLPHCYQVTDPCPPIETKPITRADCGLPENDFIFCSFNTDYKIDILMFHVWLDILGTVSQSVLWLLVRTEQARRNLRLVAQHKGIDPQRLIFAPALPKAQHLKRLQLADLALDTRIVNGHTTTSDTLWAGVPVISMQGTHFASRVASSILKSAGLEILVVQCIEDYARLAIELASDPSLLNDLKQTIKQLHTNSALFDIDRFAYNLETAYKIMWQNYQKGIVPQGFAVPDRGEQ